MTLGVVSRVNASQLTDKNVIKGKVIDEKGNPVFYASVVIKGTRNGVTTNANGSFLLTPGTGPDNITLVGSYVDYELTEVLVDKKNLSDSVIIKLRRQQPEMLVGELVICRNPPVKKELKQLPLMPAIIDDKQAAIFKIFPNPVESGSCINIEIQKMEEGYYDLQVLDQSGQSMHRQEIWIDAEARLLNINIPPVAAGSYFLSLTNKKSGKRSTEKFIVQ
jgi:hypothetical protein